MSRKAAPAAPSLLRKFVAPAAAGVLAFAGAGALWFVQREVAGAESSQQPRTRIRVPPFVFFVVWPLIYLSLAFVVLRPGRQSVLAAAAVFAYVVLSYVWIAVAGGDSAGSPEGFLLILGMLWAALVAFASAQRPSDRALLALPIAWTTAALIISSFAAPAA